MLNVLVVDDSMIMRKKITNVLGNLGHQVVASKASGLEAIEYCSDNKVPDFVTMDITMPDMDGIEATKILCKKYPEIKIVMVTSHGQENLVRDAIKNGAKGYILKPVTQDKIEEIISKVFKINQVKKETKESISTSDNLLNGNLQ